MRITVQELTDALTELDIFGGRMSYQETAEAILTGLTGMPAGQVVLTIEATP
jgi:hypothetical protein